MFPLPKYVRLLSDLPKTSADLRRTFHSDLPRGGMKPALRPARSLETQNSHTVRPFSSAGTRQRPASDLRPSLASQLGNKFR